MRRDRNFYEEFYIFIAVYSFETLSRGAKFCGVPSCVLDTSKYAEGENKLPNTESCHGSFLPNPFELIFHQSSYDQEL
jgi:hypothetical protein